ncbi:MAG: FAD/NAD(P)-binding oxidoreductase [Cyclobacteriaceae bacterium]
MDHIVIIGNGISGITAARHIRKRSDHKITVISGETDHFFSRTALMYIYMGHMEYKHTKPYEDWFWTKNRIELKKAWVSAIDFENKQLSFQGGEAPLGYDKLVLALGSKPNMFGWPGQDLKGVQGMYSFQNLEYIEKYTKDISRGVIVGGGLIGIELAEMLHSRNIPTTFLVREKSFWNGVLPPEESAMINREIINNHVDLRLETELKEIIGDENGRVKSVITGDGETIDCQFVGLTAGVTPNIQLVKDTSLEINRGIMVDEALATNIPDVYAIGDCAEFRTPNGQRRPIEQVWYTGRMMGETVARTLTGDKTPYRPGIWFNSAKFFDIEYQTYGWVWAKDKENEQSFYWEDPEKGNKSLRIVFDKTSKKVLGCNAFGLRMRHEVWDKWLGDGAQLKEVMQNLDMAHFDPEFFKRYESAIQEKYNEEFPEDQVAPRKKSLLEKIF